MLEMKMDFDDLMNQFKWTVWKPFPNPEKQEYLYAPFGCGVYQLRNQKTGEFILFGGSGNLAYRMTSLLPPPPESYGAGHRSNIEKRNYVWQNIDNVEYRTVTCKNKEEQAHIEQTLRSLNVHIFNT